MSLHRLFRPSSTLLSTTRTFSTTTSRRGRPTPLPTLPRNATLHDRVQFKIRSGDLHSASLLAREAVLSTTRPTVATCNSVLSAMHRARLYDEVASLFRFFFNQCDIIPNIASYNILINSHCDSGRVEEAIKVYDHIVTDTSFFPSPATYRHLTKGLMLSGRVSDAFTVKCLSKATAEIPFSNTFLGSDSEMNNLKWLPHSWITSLVNSWRQNQLSNIHITSTDEMDPETGNPFNQGKVIFFMKGGSKSSAKSS